MEIERNTAKRLAFIKYLYQHGISISNKPEPLSASSILIFHDAVELFLRLTSELYDAGRSHIRFMEYWEILSSHIPSGTLPQKEAMRRLNQSRVNLKHHGAFPSKLDIESYRAIVGSFFNEASPLIFGLEFDEISLTDFIEVKEARKNLEKATMAINDDKLVIAAEHCAIAFKVLLDTFEERYTKNYRRSPFSFGDDLVFLDTNFLDHFKLLFDDFDERYNARQFRTHLKEYLDKTKKSIEELQETVKILSIGIDYPSFAHFRSVTPYISRKLNGEYIRTSESKEVTEEDMNFCINFVFETAFYLQDFDFQITDSVY
jgi:hypothetical protein